MQNVSKLSKLFKMLLFFSLVSSLLGFCFLFFGGLGGGGGTQSLLFIVQAFGIKDLN